MAFPKLYARHRRTGKIVEVASLTDTVKTVKGCEVLDTLVAPTDGGPLLSLADDADLLSLERPPRE